MFSPAPAMGTILYALEVPSAGGDTMFTNQYLAYESLSDAMRKMLDGLKVVCVGDNFKQHGGKSRKDRYSDVMSQMKVKRPRQRADHHRCIRWSARIPKPAASRCIVGGHVQHFEGMTDEESEPLDRLPEEALHPAGIHLPLPLGNRIAGVLGQPLHPAFRGQRLSGGDPHHAPHHGAAATCRTEPQRRVKRRGGRRRPPA